MEFGKKQNYTVTWRREYTGNLLESKNVTFDFIRADGYQILNLELNKYRFAIVKDYCGGWYAIELYTGCRFTHSHHTRINAYKQLSQSLKNVTDRTAGISVDVLVNRLDEYEKDLKEKNIGSPLNMIMIEGVIK